MASRDTGRPPGTAQCGKIPACDLIDVSFMDKQWHTQADTPEHCSALSLAKVGWVLREWLKKQ